jgi:hypothetical protein
VGCQRHASAALPPGMTRYPLYRRLGGPGGRSGGVSFRRLTAERYPYQYMNVEYFPRNVSANSKI